MAPSPGKRSTGQPHNFDSHLCLHLVRQWAWGQKSAGEVQKEAALALKDQHELLQRLKLSRDFASRSLTHIAAIGSAGANPGSCSRDLKNLLGNPIFPEPHYEPVPMKVLKPKDSMETVVTESFPIQDPHVLFAWYYHHHREVFNILVLDGDASLGKLEAFWKHVWAKKDPRLNSHNLKDRPGWNTEACPASFHGDAVPCLSIGKSGTQSFNVYSFSGILGSGTTLEQKHFVYGNFTACEVEEEEQDFTHAVWVRLLWSLHFAFLGIWPTVTHFNKPFPPGSPEAQRAGQKLADGLFLVIWSLKADLDHLAKAYGLPHYGSLFPCCLCPATADQSAPQDMWYNNFKHNARWKTKVYTCRDFQKLFPDPFYIFQLGYLTAVNVDPDELHIMHLGTSMYFLGSVLWIICFEHLGGSPDDNMNTIWGDIAKMYREIKTPCQFTNLTVNSFCDKTKPSDHYPKLKGKGAEVKDLVLPLSKIWSLRKNNSKQRNLIDKAFKALVGIQKILHDHADKAVLPTGQSETFDKLVTDFLQSYTILANIADKESRLLLSMVPKFHYLWHLGKRAKFLNPRRGNTCIDEDYVGQCKDLVAKCAAGNEAHRVPCKFIERYQWGMYIQLMYGL